MDSVIAKKILESKEHIQNAEKSLKTSFFKRTPDYDTAASEYNKAGMASKIAKQYDMAIQCFRKSAECYINLRSPFNAAKQYEQVAFAANEFKKYDIIFDSINKASNLFLENGTRDSAGILLEKGANMLKFVEPAFALSLYKRAIEVAEIEDKYHEMNSLYENAIIITVKLRMFNDAIELIKNCINVLEKINSNDSISKQILTLTIIYLSRDDWVSATKEVRLLKERYQLDANSKAFSFSEDLIDAYDEKDEDRFRTAIKSYLTYAVDNEVLKLAQQIIKTGEWNTNIKHKESIAPTPSASAAAYEPSSNHQIKEEIAKPPSYEEIEKQNFEDIKNQRVEDQNNNEAVVECKEPKDSKVEVKNNDDDDDEIDLL